MPTPFTASLSFPGVTNARTRPDRTSGLAPVGAGATGSVSMSWTDTHALASGIVHGTAGMIVLCQCTGGSEPPAPVSGSMTSLSPQPPDGVETECTAPFPFADG